MSVPSLAGLCRKTIFANIDELSYVSTLPYEKCREILKYIKTAQQLAIIEEYSPQIVGEDSELWEAFIKKDFRVPMKRKQYEPENPRSWRKVYERYAKEEEEAEAHALEQLGATYAGLNKRKQQDKTVIADPRFLPNLPKIGRIGRRRAKGAFGVGTANLTFGGGARTSNVVAKARKEAMEVAARKKLSTPLVPRKPLVKVQEAPASMRNEYRIKRQPAFGPQIPKLVSADDERAQREARLLAAKKAKAQPQVLRDDELDDRPARSRAVGVGRPAAAAATRPTISSNAKKSTGLFSRAQNPTREPHKVLVKTASQSISRASPDKATTALKARPGHPVESARKHPASSKPATVSPPSRGSSRQQIPRSGNSASRAPDSSRLSRLSSPGSEEFRIGKIAPRRASPSPSATSSLFGSPERGSPASDRRRASPQSSDGNAPSSSRRREGSSEAARVQPGTPLKRKVEAPASASTSSAAAAPDVDGGAGVQPLRKKKKVDIFMRPKPKAGR